MAKKQASKKKKLSKKSKCDFLCGRLATMRIGRLNMCDECAGAPREVRLSDLSLGGDNRNS
jgi:hypothetical protein